METTDVIVIGAGQAGLATSHALHQRGIAHLVLERGRVAERWRSERWDSLRLLTPNWLTRLPGFEYRGPQPDGFMTMPEVTGHLERYAAVSGAPVRAHTRVSRVVRAGSRYLVCTDRGAFRARHVVLATGYCDVPSRPRLAGSSARRLHQLAPTEYRNPSALPPGGVLIVGGSASGAQIADDLARAGREVTLALGRHTRLPRRYRGADIMRWLDRIGALDETLASVHDAAAARAQPSLQLIGSDPPRNLDLSTLSRLGVRITGRLLDVSGEHAAFAPDLACTIQRADQKLQRLLQRIDRQISECALEAPAEDPPAAIDIRALPCVERLHLARERISTVIWATGFLRDYKFLRIPIVGPDGELAHARGITPAAGVYAVGLRFQHTRKSSFIDGVGADAEYVVRDIAARLGNRESFAA